jgi:hypothetical protein
MQPLTAYGVTVLSLVATALGVILFLRRPLSRVLLELCGAEHRADLWMRLAVAAVPLTVLFFSLLFSPGPDATSVEVALRVLRSGLLGLLISLGVLGFFLLLFVGRFEHREQHARLVERAGSTGTTT